MQQISTAYADDYSPDSMDRAVAAHFAAQGWDALFAATTRVVLKPNLLMKRAPERVTTTHPELAAAVVRYLRRLGVTDIILADSPGGPYTRTLLREIYKGCGMQTAEQAGCKLNTDTAWHALPNPKGQLVREFNIIAPILAADVIINLPKLKSHGMMVMSGGIKNLFGCVPGLQKPEMHFRFSRQEDFATMLVDLACLIKPAITIVDAVEAMEGDGPSAGQRYKAGITFGAGDLFVLDRAMCDFIGFDPALVPTVKASVDLGLAPASAEELVYSGEGKPAQLKDFRYPASVRQLDFTDNLPPPLRGAGKLVRDRFLEPRPLILAKKCIGCGKCAESCAPGAIAIHKKIAVIDQGRCIKCYCCHEMCPVGAVTIKKSALR